MIVQTPEAYERQVFVLKGRIQALESSNSALSKSHNRVVEQCTKLRDALKELVAENQKLKESADA